MLYREHVCHRDWQSTVGPLVTMSDKLKYSSVADLRANYPDFFWKTVRPYIGDALRYLRVTQEGQQWIANLYANVFSMEHRAQLF